MRRLAENQKRVRTGLLLTALGLAASCGGATGSEGVGVEVSFDSGLPRSGRDQAVRVEVYVIESCDSVSPGRPPEDAIAETYVLRDGGTGPPLGSLDAGEYGLYAMARDSSCSVVAAGCAVVKIDAETNQPLSVVLGASSGRGCSGGEQCIVATGECIF